MIMATVEEFKSAAVAKKAPVGFPEMLKSYLPEIQRALPKHLSGDRMARIVLTAFRRSPKLAECDPRSVFACVIQASQLGLEPDMLGRSYLIPYGKECTFVPGWKGLVDLVNRAGQATVWTGAVFEGDKFEYQLGDAPFVKHQPGEEDDPDKLTHVYAIGRVKGAEFPNIEVWSIGKVMKHLKRYNKVGNRHYAFSNLEMYARKVCLLQVLKYMPCSADMVAAMSLNDAAETGDQNLSVNDAINGTWVPPVNDDAQDVEYKEQNIKAEPKPEAKTKASGLTLQTLKERFAKCNDLALLKIDFDLIASLPVEDQESANEEYMIGLDRLSR
jgi:recombination protein RecT